MNSKEKNNTKKYRITVLSSISAVKNCQHPKRLLVLSQVEDLASLSAPSQNIPPLSAREGPTMCRDPSQSCGEERSTEHPSAVIWRGAGQGPGQPPANARVKLPVRPVDDSCHSAGGRNASFFTLQSPAGQHPD